MIDTIRLEKTPIKHFDIRPGITTLAGIQTVDLATEDILSMWQQNPSVNLNTAPIADIVVLGEHDNARRVDLPPSWWQTFISDLPGEPYTLYKPIPIKIERIDEKDFLASFEEANIDMSGETEQEAFQNLIAEILNAFEDFSKEMENLGPEPARQLRVFKQYLAQL